MQSPTKWILSYFYKTSENFLSMCHEKHFYKQYYVTWWWSHRLNILLFDKKLENRLQEEVGERCAATDIPVHYRTDYTTQTFPLRDYRL